MTKAVGSDRHMDYYQQAVKEAEIATREAEGAKKLMWSVMATIVRHRAHTGTTVTARHGG